MAARTKARRGTKASRSASAKKAAATRKRNAAKRSAAAKKAAATRKRNARKGSRKASTSKRRPTKAKRSAAAKKAAATRKRNAAKRSRAAKKAAATRKRNARKGSRKASTKRRASSKRKGTKASRSAAAKKAWRTRKRNAAKRSRAAKRGASKRRRASTKRKASTKRRSSSKAKRSAAARKGWRTRRRGGRKASTKRRRASSKRRRGSRRARSSVASVKKTGKSFTDAMMNGAKLLPDAIFSAATAFVAIGLYNAIEPMAWDKLKITGANGYIARAVSFIPGSANVNADIQNFAEKSLAVATIGGLAYLLSDSKALNLVDKKLAAGATGLAAFVYGLNFLGEMQTANLGNVFGALSKGNFGVARNSFMAGGLGRIGNTHHNLNVALPPTNNMGGATNYALQQTMQTANTAAIQQGSGTSGFFGSRGGLGSARVNLF